MASADKGMPPQWKGPPESNSGATQPHVTDEGGGGGGWIYDAPMHERVAKLETVVANLATKVDIEALRADIERGQKENRAWMLATVLALFAGILGAGGLVLTALKPSSGQPSAVTTTPQPIVIQIPPQPQAVVPAQAPAQPPPPPAKP